MAIGIHECDDGMLCMPRGRDGCRGDRGAVPPTAITATGMTSMLIITFMNPPIAMTGPALDSCGDRSWSACRFSFYAPLVPGFIEPHEHGEIALNWLSWDLPLPRARRNFIGRAPLSRKNRGRKIATLSKPFTFASVNKSVDEIYAFAILQPFNWIAKKSLFPFRSKPSSTARSTARELPRCDEPCKKTGLINTSSTAP